jgi:hypothetical protein
MPRITDLEVLDAFMQAHTAQMAMDERKRIEKEEEILAQCRARKS